MKANDDEKKERTNNDSNSGKLKDFMFGIFGGFKLNSNAKSNSDLKKEKNHASTSHPTIFKFEEIISSKRTLKNCYTKNKTPDSPPSFQGIPTLDNARSIFKSENSSSKFIN